MSSISTTVGLGREELVPERLLRPGALRQAPEREGEPGGLLEERIRRNPRPPWSERLEAEFAEVEARGIAAIPVAEAEREREAVEPLEPVVVGPAQLVVDADGSRTRRVRRLLLLDECIDERLNLGGA